MPNIFLSSYTNSELIVWFFKPLNKGSKLQRTKFVLIAKSSDNSQFYAQTNLANGILSDPCIGWAYTILLLIIYHGTHNMLVSCIGRMRDKDISIIYQEYSLFFFFSFFFFVVRWKSLLLQKFDIKFGRGTSTSSLVDKITNEGKQRGGDFHRLPLIAKFGPKGR